MTHRVKSCVSYCLAERVCHCCVCVYLLCSIVLLKLFSLPCVLKYFHLLYGYPVEFTILSDCAIPSLMNAAFTFSMLDSQISSLMVAESRISPFFSGVSSRHFLAVIPNIAMFGTSASLVYFMTACPHVTSGGMRSVLMASV